MGGVRVKICGITRLDDALCAVECGADALGFVFYADSPRCVSEAEAAAIIAKLPPFVSTVGVFVNEKVDVIKGVARQAGLNCIQLHGDETLAEAEALPLKVVKAVRVGAEGDGFAIESFGESGVSAILLDTYNKELRGGTGECFDWDFAVKAKEHAPIILSGGLNADNVAEAIRRVEPYGVDVSSGVEQGPGIKDHDKIKEFISKARSARR